MTLPAVGFGRGFPRAWLLPISLLTLVLGVAAFGGLSRAIVADLIAWWPIWLGLGLAAYFYRDRKLGTIRLSGLIPLVALFFVVLFIWGHLAGWPIMPSASHHLVGPESAEFTHASLSASIDGRVEAHGGSEFLYQVEPINDAGTVGIPTATEDVLEDTVHVRLDAPVDPGLYAYAGWEIILSSNPVWDLRLDGAVDADLTEVELAGLSVNGSGTVRLGNPGGVTPVSIHGGFVVVVPANQPVSVVGVASVPATWQLTPEGAASPAPGEGWVITVVGDATLRVVEG